MDKKGFTLTELLAVIVILGIIMTIGIRSVYSINHAARKKLLATKIEEIETAAIKYGQEHTFTSDNCNSVTFKDSEGKTQTFDATFCIKDITVQTLIDSKDFETKEKNNKVLNPVTNNPLNEEEVFIYKKNNRVYAILTNKYKILDET